MGQRLRSQLTRPLLRVLGISVVFRDMAHDV